jgi:hypothetical protein
MKKLLKMLGLLFVAAMLVSCSGNDPDPITEYHLYYDDCFLGRASKAEFEQLFTYNALSRGSDCNISGSNLTFTANGFTKYLGLIDASAFVVYSTGGTDYANPISEATYNHLGDVLEQPEDYTLKGNGKIVVLTDAGYANQPGLLGN